MSPILVAPTSWMISPPRAMPQSFSSPELWRNRSAHRFNNLLERFLHVPGLQNFVLAPLEVEAQHRNAPLIDDVRIDLAVAILVGNHFAAAREMDFAAVEFA